MPRDGAYNYSLPEAPFSASTLAQSARVNNNFTDIATALTDSLTRGETTLYTRSLLDDADAATARGTLGLGNNWQWSATTAVSGSPVANVIFTLPTTATRVLVEWESASPSGGAAGMFCRFSVDGGATYLSGASDYDGVFADVGFASVTTGGMSSASYIALTPTMPTTWATTGRIEFPRVAGASAGLDSWGVSSAPARFRRTGHGGCASASVPTHILFGFVGVNIAVGSRFTIFGRA